MEKELLEIKNEELKYIFCPNLNLLPFEGTCVVSGRDLSDKIINPYLYLFFGNRYCKIHSECTKSGDCYMFPLFTEFGYSKDYSKYPENCIEIKRSEIKEISFYSKRNLHYHVDPKSQPNMIHITMRSEQNILIMARNSSTQGIPEITLNFFDSKNKNKAHDKYFDDSELTHKYLLSELYTTYNNA